MLSTSCPAFLFLFHLLLISFTLGNAADSILGNTLGIAPQDESYFRSSVIKCKDGSGKFTREQLNDEFCDCPDGTDEPGTSACPEGRFYCRNSGHTPVFIFSSRVNDGICDCCDGSDEYSGKTKCPDTCWEAGKVARDRLKKRIAIFEEGVAIRRQEAKKMQDAFHKDEADLAKLEDEVKQLKGLVQKLKGHKEQIEKAEEQERLKREKEEQRVKELELKEKDVKASEEVPDTNVKGIDKEPTEPSPQEETEKIHVPTIEVEHGLDERYMPSDDHGVHEKDQESPVSDDELTIPPSDEDITPEIATEKSEESDESEGLSKEEIGRRVASRWTGEKVDEEKDGVGSGKRNEEEEQNADLTESAEGEDYDGYNSETDDDNDKYDDDDFNDKAVDDEGENVLQDHDPEWRESDLSEYSTSTSQSWLGKIQQTMQNVLQTINLFKSPLNISEAARIRKEYDGASSRLSKMEARISSLTEKLKLDFGNEKEFYSFYNQCFEGKQNKYTYKVCPFKQASQIEGHSTTRLGAWDKFEESYRVMQFSRGDKCWNGPDRSLMVRLKCGLKNELIEVDEPSRCEYVAVFSTPLLCLDTKLKELKDKLELLTSGQPVSHDEL